MLVLTRKEDEVIVIPISVDGGLTIEYINITVVDIRDKNVRLGITAPKHIKVHRKEVYETIQREKCINNGRDKT